MFKYIKVVYRWLPDGELFHCAVSLDRQIVVPFHTEDKARQAAQLFSENPANLVVGYRVFNFFSCFYADTGLPLSGPAPASPVVVNVLGLDYSVPKPVADQLASCRAALTAACLRVKELEDTLESETASKK